VISVSACGSLKEKVKPGEFVIVDQFLDRTRHRADTFFTGGIVAHVAFADPVCPTLARLIYDTATELNIPAHWAGTYVCMEGPQFSTRAESLLYRSWGMDVIGMTNYTEARLAREAEMHYATMAMVTDYDCWRSHDADVDIIDILRVMRENAEHAKQIIAATVGKIQHPEDACTCAGALEHAIITHRELIPAAKIKELGPLVEKYLK
jgi:5'-methylthioadenosine phosphorylase